MPATTRNTLAQRIRDGGEAIGAATAGIIRLAPTNLVERPWGGLRILDYKGCAPLPDQKKVTGLGVGESFETAACPSDAETAAHPSVAILSDDSVIDLPDLLACAGAQVLGSDLFARCGAEIPLLPKTLDIAELLSMQAHPPGNTELYVIIDAEPGASIRLGFRHSIDAASLRAELNAGIENQQRLRGLLADDLDANALHNRLAPLLAARGTSAAQAVAALRGWLRSDADADSVGKLFEALRDVYWHVLDLMNEIVVHPGQIIYNANPARVSAATGRPATAEVHALGNPQQREILMLEIRRPGLTYRAWDNVRFPVRPIDIDETLAALHLGATSPEEFEVTPTPVDGQPGVFALIREQAFAVDQLRPSANVAIDLPGGRFETLHAIRGEIRIKTADGSATVLSAGRSAIVPAALPGGRILSDSGAEVIRVWIPEHAAGHQRGS